jgi:hypothetical protein
LRAGAVLVDIPPVVSAFIADHIDSVVQLELLLLLRAEPQKSFRPTVLAKGLAIDPVWAEGQLRKLCSSGVLSCTQAPEPAYQYAPRTPELHLAVQGLAQAYADRRVSVIALIFSKPSEQLRSFSDAFRLRKDEPDA